MARHRPTVVIGLALTILLSGTTAACTSDGPQPAPSPSTQNLEPTRGPTAPDGGQIRVAESGFSVSYSTALTEFALGTFGVIVENTSKTHAAVGVRATATFLDNAGQEMEFSDSISTLSSDVITVLPGERKGLGSHVETRGRKDKKTPARMELKIAAFEWWPTSRVRSVTASDLRYERNASGVDSFTFTVDSQLTRPLENPRVIIILRDKAGKVIGGLDPDKPETSWPPGRSRQRVRMLVLRLVPDTADTARLEVHIGDAETDDRPA